MAVLVYTDIEGKRRLAKLKSGRNTIGRRTQNDIILNIATVSRHHASIILEGGQYLLNDAGSSNGSKVNGIRVKEEVMLKHGDVISLGECELVLLVSDEPVAVPRDESTAGAEKSAAKGDVPEPPVDDDEGNGSEAPTAVPESHGTGAPIDAAEIDKPEAPIDIDLGEIAGPQDGPEDAPAPDPAQDDYDVAAFFEEDEGELQTVETEAAKEEEPGGEDKASDVRQRRPARRGSKRSERRSRRASQRKGPNYVAIASVLVSVGCAVGIVALLPRLVAGKRPAETHEVKHQNSAKVVRKNPALDFLGEAEKCRRLANEVITAEQKRKDQGLEYREEELKKAEKHYQKAYDMFDEFNTKYPGEQYAGYRVEGKMREINIRLRFIRNELYMIEMRRLRQEQ